MVCDVVRGLLRGPRSVLQTLWAAAVACVLYWSWRVVCSLLRGLWSVTWSVV